MKKAVAIKTITIVIAAAAILFAASAPLLAQHSYVVKSGSLDGELKSKDGAFGEYELGEKSINRGALGGGTRGYEWVINSSKSPGKRGALGAIDGEPDAGGGSKGNTFTTTALGESIRIGQTYTSSYEIFKGFLSFDTSGIPYDAIITSATLTIYGKDKRIAGGNDFFIQVHNSIWTEPLWNPDWGAITSSSRASLNTTNFSVEQTNDISISALNANYLIEKGGVTRIALVSSRTASEISPSGDEYVEIYSSNATDPNKRPRLDIEYNGDAPNIRPSLTWTGEQYYKMNAVYPQEIFVGENTLTFKVQYTHMLGTAPVKTQVWIDLNADGDFYDAGEQVDMRAADLNDTDYTNGKLYYANVTLNSDGMSDIHYRFVFTDESDVEAIGTPAQVANLTPIQAEEKNICFIDTAQDKDSASSLANFIEKRPLLYNLFSSFANHKVMVHISF
ncbi:MAG: DNRLRE domain-containing protein [bacterium]